MLTYAALIMYLCIAPLSSAAGSILDISKYRDTCERSISILDGIAILRYIEYRNYVDVGRGRCRPQCNYIGKL